MKNPKWLEEVEKILPALQRTAQGCDTPFQVKCFELLLGHALERLSHVEEPYRTEVTKDTSPRFAAFLREHEFTREDIAQILDIEEGEVLVGSLGRNNAERQRTLAALMAARSLALEGDPRVRKEVLRERCKKMGCYDTANFSSNVKDHQYQNARVFTEVEDGWRVSAPGMRFIADTLSSLLEKVRT